MFLIYVLILTYLIFALSTALESETPLREMTLPDSSLSKKRKKPKSAKHRGGASTKKKKKSKTNAPTDTSTLSSSAKSAKGKSVNKSTGKSARKGKAATFKSRYTGVSYYTSYEKWQSQITISKQKSHLGYYQLQADAALAYDDAKKEHWGPKTKTNFASQAEYDEAKAIELQAIEIGPILPVEKVSSPSPGDLVLSTDPHHLVLHSRLRNVITTGSPNTSPKHGAMKDSYETMLSLPKEDCGILIMVSIYYFVFSCQPLYIHLLIQ